MSGDMSSRAMRLAVRNKKSVPKRTEAAQEERARSAAGKALRGWLRDKCEPSFNLRMDPAQTQVRDGRPPPCR